MSNRQWLAEVLARAAGQIGEGFSRGVGFGLESKQRRAEQEAARLAAENAASDASMRADDRAARGRIHSKEMAAKQHDYRMEELGARAKAPVAGLSPFAKEQTALVGKLGSAQANENTITDLGSIPAADSPYLREYSGGQPTNNYTPVDPQLMGPPQGEQVTGQTAMRALYGRGVNEGAAKQQSNKVAAAIARKRPSDSAQDVYAKAFARAQAVEPFKRAAALRALLGQLKKGHAGQISDVAALTGGAAQIREVEAALRDAELQAPAGQVPTGAPARPTPPAAAPPAPAADPVQAKLEAVVRTHGLPKSPQELEAGARALGISPAELQQRLQRLR